METIDTKLIYDLTTSVDELEAQYRVRTYEKAYEDILASIEIYEEMPYLVYANNDTWTELYYMGDWYSGVYLTQGKLGSMAPSMSAFGAKGVIEDVKEYDCRLDDLSDSYLLMDGEKTVAEAKQEIEEYLDAHYPLTGEDNGSQIERVITEFVPFQDVMDGVAHYLTSATKFQLLRGGVEYRVFTTEEGYHMIPYWCFVAKNPNDDSMLKIYVDMETGEIDSWEY